ncbi:MAG TPA: glycosyltransferase [Candidatus Omnitrophica bacterium]|nr:glycosyltransferase [Candidatus Omnitrophota bacterium]
MCEKIEYSIVIPVLNEEKIIHELSGRINKVMDSLKVAYEVIFVDDGSNDSTFEILNGLHKDKKNVKIIKLCRNFGHHIAITAGLDFVKAQDGVILMDGDLQDEPEQIVRLLEKFNKGYDIVYAERESQKVYFFKRLFSDYFYKIFKKLTKIEIPPNTGIFRIISPRVVATVRNCPEKSRFITGLMSWAGFSSAVVKTPRADRFAGKPKYNISKSQKLAMDAIISFSPTPLSIIIFIGISIALFSFIMAMYMIAKKILFGIPVSGYASLIVSIFFLSGVQLFVLGMIGEYVGRIYTEVKNRPLYVIDKKIGFE